MRRTKEAAQQTRQEIMLNALALFEHQGYAATSMTDIAKASGVTRGAIYWYFADKTDIFLTLGEKYLTAPLNRYRAKMHGDGVWQAFVDEVLAHVESLEKDTTHRRFERLITFQRPALENDAKLKTSIHHYNVSWIATINETLARAIELKELPQNLDREWAFWQINSTLFGALYLSTSHYEAGSIGSMSSTVVRATFNLISGA